MVESNKNIDTITPVNFEAETIAYAATNAFSAIVNDYLQADEKLKPFYRDFPGLPGIQQSITRREKFAGNRVLLNEYLLRQYQGVANTNRVKENIERLLDPNCYTVCTAHQPNIFTGHLYFIYKILHAIVLASKLNLEFPNNHFVPVYYMGSEDADLEELGEVTVEGKKYTWHTKQTGAVGRMQVDDELLAIIAAIKNQLIVKPFGKEAVELIETVYTKGKSMQQATLELVHALFGKYGLIVFIPDAGELKRPFLPLAEKEIKEQFSAKAVNETIKNFPEKYKIQTAGRDINLFYLTNSARLRIEREDNNFRVGSETLALEELITRFEKEPECISPNVVLRPVFQEMILPNVAFIGGGGELAYWLELKNVFEAAQIPFPVLILRNSFLTLNAKAVEILEELDLSLSDIFTRESDLINRFILREKGEEISLAELREQIRQAYDKIADKAGMADKTLVQHTAALFTRADQKLDTLEGKMLRAEKKKVTTTTNKISKLKSIAFPNGTLQERVENFLSFYSLYGSSWLDAIRDNSPAFSNEFIILKQKG